MNWLWVILIGLIVGALAKLLTPGRDPGGFIVTTLLGIGGSLVATVLGRALGWYQDGSPQDSLCRSLAPCYYWSSITRCDGVQLREPDGGKPKRASPVLFAIVQSNKKGQPGRA